MSLESDLITLVEMKKYEEAIAFIENNPTVNLDARTKNGSTLLFQTTISGHKSPEFYAFMDYFLSHPNLTDVTSSCPRRTRTPFQSAINTYDINLVNIYLKHHQEKGINVVSDNSNQLFYVRLTQNIEANYTLIRNHEEFTETTLPEIRKQKTILSVLRDVAIRHALLTDDVSILETLAQHNESFLTPLSDGKMPFELIEELPELKTHQWLAEHLKDKKPSALALAAASFLKLKEEEKELEYAYRKERQHIVTQVQSSRSKSGLASFFSRMFGSEKSDSSSESNLAPK